MFLFQEIDAKDVILDSNDEGEDEDSDEDAELVLKNKPQHFDEDSGNFKFCWH